MHTHDLLGNKQIASMTHHTYILLPKQDNAYNFYNQSKYEKKTQKREKNTNKSNQHQFSLWEFIYIDHTNLQL